MPSVAGGLALVDHRADDQTLNDARLTPDTPGGTASTRHTPDFGYATELMLR